jgi:hypothetical protein
MQVEENTAMGRTSGRVSGLAIVLGAALGTGVSLADERIPFTLEVEDASAKVGEKTAVEATITPPQGVRLTTVYRHRVIDLSAFDDEGVEFEDQVVIGSLKDDGSLVFDIGVTPTEPGTHPINGLIRVSFVDGNKTESKSVPLMATVTGTQ